MPMLNPGTRMHDIAELDAAYGPGTLTVVTPLTATTVAFTQGQTIMYINPAGTIAALTVLLPPNPIQGQRAQMSFGQIVTALTVQTAAGGAVASTAGAVGAEISYRYINGAWVAWD
jgi:hypothetical protein